MRGSGTEPVFRVLCDVRGDKPEQEEKLLEWETKMLLKADGQL
jgi:phosphoglucomutase